MNAAMYMPGLAPGSMSWTIYRAFRDELRAAGVELRILTDWTMARQAAGTEVEALPRPGGGALRLLDRAAAPLTRNASFLQTTVALRRWLAARACLDVLYIEIAYPLGAAAALARRSARWKGRLIVTPMGEDFLVLPAAAYGYRRHPLPDHLVRWAVRQADGIRCISPVVERWIMEVAPDTPRILLPLNVAPKTTALASEYPGQLEARKAKAAEDLRARLEIGERGLVGSLGRLHPFKGIHVLIEALSRLEKADLVVAGPTLEVRGYGDYRRHLESLAERRGLSDRVHFVGKISHDRVPDFLAAIDVLVVPSLLESLNRVCVEAAAAGTPFVVTETTGISELLPASEQVGRTVGPDDADSLARAIDTVLSGDWPYDREAATRWVQSFDPSQISPALASWLRNRLR